MTIPIILRLYYLLTSPCQTRCQTYLSRCAEMTSPLTFHARTHLQATEKVILRLKVSASGSTVTVNVGTGLEHSARFRPYCSLTEDSRETHSGSDLTPQCIRRTHLLHLIVRFIAGPRPTVRDLQQYSHTDPQHPWLTRIATVFIPSLGSEFRLCLSG